MNSRAAGPRSWQPSLSAANSALVSLLGILLVNGTVMMWLLLLGHGFLPETVPLEWWSASTLTADNSQHLTDVYSTLHAASGAVLYFALKSCCPTWPLHYHLLTAIACSGVWELVENTPAVIALFNNPADPGSYHGDSIINALSDTAFVAFGFLAAQGFPRWLIIAGGFALAALWIGVTIHDDFIYDVTRTALR